MLRRTRRVGATISVLAIAGSLLALATPVHRPGRPGPTT
jgi:hypothetical protein